LEFGIDEEPLGIDGNSIGLLLDNPHRIGKVLVVLDLKSGHDLANAAGRDFDLAIAIELFRSGCNSSFWERSMSYQDSWDWRLLPIHVFGIFSFV
jgi:hypothetical protein